VHPATKSVTQAMSKTKVLFATEDSDLLVSLLIYLREEAEFDIAGTARDPASLVALMTSTHPDVVLVDEALFDGGVAVIVEPLRQLEPRPWLVVMAAEENERPAQVAADVVILKFASPGMLLESLKQVTG
jgi:DNA-binding NarL/FixJ family response regulator